MKKIFSLLMVGTVALGGMTSCSDYLEEDNKTGATADLTYSTNTGIKGLVSSAYAYGRLWWGKEPSLGLAECGSDLFYAGHDNKQTLLVKYEFTSESLGNEVNNNPCFDQYWEAFYAGINVCNNVMLYVPQVSDDVVKAVDKSKYLGDAYFLRSLYYLQLVATYGPVPFNPDPVDADNITDAPVRQPEAVIYGHILDDLKKAMDYYKEGGAMTKATSSDASLGHAYYYSAEALYARAALYAASWLGNNSVSGHDNLYKEAQDAAQDVIDNSGAALYDNYNSTWNMANEEASKNTENLFAVHYGNTVTSGYDNMCPYRYTDNGTGQYNSLITRKGYSNNGGSVNFLMFTPTWNNGCADLGGNGVKNSCVFVRVLGEATSQITSAITGGLVTIDSYYSPYACGYTRYTPSLQLWKMLDAVKNTDQRYNTTIITHYNCPLELTGNAKKYPEMYKQRVSTKDPNSDEWKAAVTADAQSYADAYAADGNYFNGGVPAIVYSLLDGNSAEGKALQAEAKDKYRLQFAYNGDIPVYTSGDVALAEPSQSRKNPSDVYGDDRYNNDKIGGWYSFPGIKKFTDDQFDKTNYSCSNAISYRDIMVLRLAEMYLIEAEAQLGQGNTGGATSTINTLRAKRAISGKDNSLSAVYGESSVNLDGILRERALELCGEYQRWFDLKRTHKLLEYVKAYNHQASQNIAMKHYYRPIPSTEFSSVSNASSNTYQQDANGVIQYTSVSEEFWQNPGY